MWTVLSLLPAESERHILLISNIRLSALASVVLFMFSMYTLEYVQSNY